LRSETSYEGYHVAINGTVTCNDEVLSGTPILLAYSVTNGATWNDITLTTTDSTGAYDAVWLPDATGNFLVRAVWNGNTTFPSSSVNVALAVTPFEEKTFFSVTSNSTITNLVFKSLSRKLSFSISGPSGTTGFVEVTIAKYLIADISKLNISLNGTDLSYTATSTDDVWRLVFTYHHSTHDIVVNLGELPILLFIQTPVGITLIVVGIIAILVVLFRVMKRRR